MTSENKIKEVKEKAKIFLKNKTLVFVKLIKNNNRVDFRNGYIKEIKESFFLLEDLKLNDIIPVFYNEIMEKESIFEPSRIKIEDKKNENVDDWA